VARQVHIRKGDSHDFVRRQEKAEIGGNGEVERNQRKLQTFRGLQGTGLSKTYRGSLQRLMKESNFSSLARRYCIQLYMVLSGSLFIVG